MSEKDLKTSHLLFDESPLLVRPELATRVGLNESLILQQIHYWLENKRKATKERDLKDEKTYIDGKFWTYDSYPEWQKQFPFWSLSTIERTFKALEKAKILISGNYNTWKADRTKWYTIDYEALDRYVKPKRKSKHDKKEIEVSTENVDIEQSVKLTDVDIEHSVNLTAPFPQLDDMQSVKLTRAFPQLDEMDSVKLTAPIPKSSSESSPETSSLDFTNSSSSLIDEEIYNIVEEPNDKNEEEEYQVNRSLMYLGYELAQSGIMRTNAQIQQILKGTVDRKLLPFQDVDVANAINHYKAECVKRGKIGVPVDFFLNGFEMKLNQRFSGSVGANERKRKLESLSEQLSNSDVPFYNWLDA